jgi:hypothetical protein
MQWVQTLEMLKKLIILCTAFPPHCSKGTESVHSSLRGRVVAYIWEHGDDYAPFVEDDQTLEQHLAKMNKVGMLCSARL